MRQRRGLWVAILLLAGWGPSALGQDAPPTRELNGINWIDFKAWVPERINTVLLPVGTLEAHGVANNGADNTVPASLAGDLAQRINGMVAPTVPYGLTTSLSAFPGTFRVSPEVFEAYVTEVIRGLARNGFANIIVVNGHGPNRAPLERACSRVSEETGARTMVFDWWTYTSDVTKEVYGTDGGHAGVNETAAVLATTPQFVRAALWREDLAGWGEPGVFLYPNPNSVLLYTPDRGYPDFDEGRAQLFYRKVLDKLESLLRKTIEKWERM